MKHALSLLLLWILCACQTPDGAARRELDAHWQIVDRFLAWEYHYQPGGRPEQLAEQIREEYPALWEEAARLARRAGDPEQRMRRELLLLRLRAITTEIASLWTP